MDQSESIGQGAIQFDRNKLSSSSSSRSSRSSFTAWLLASIELRQLVMSVESFSSKSPLNKDFQQSNLQQCYSNAPYRSEEKCKSSTAAPNCDCDTLRLAASVWWKIFSLRISFPPVLSAVRSCPKGTLASIMRVLVVFAFNIKMDSIWHGLTHLKASVALNNRPHPSV